jgi:hypothetical protein
MDKTMMVFGDAKQVVEDMEAFFVANTRLSILCVFF